MANRGQPDLSDVPTAFELADKLDDPERAKAILTALGVTARCRPVRSPSPPGTDADKVQFLSAALDSALNDPELLDVAKNSGRPINHASG